MTDTPRLLEAIAPPTTDTVGLLRAPHAEVVASYLAWMRALGWQCASHPCDDLPRGLALLRAASPAARKQLFVSARAGWTGLLDDGERGSDPTSAVSTRSRLCGWWGLIFKAIPPGARAGGLGAFQLQVYAPQAPPGAPSNLIRALSRVHDGQRWEELDHGEPLAFERAAGWRGPGPDHPLDGDMLSDYARALGVDPFRLDWFESETTVVELLPRQRPA